MQTQARACRPWAGWPNSRHHKNRFDPKQLRKLYCHVSSSPGAAQLRLCPGAVQKEGQRKTRAPVEPIAVHSHLFAASLEKSPKCGHERAREIPPGGFPWDSQMLSLAMVGDHGALKREESVAPNGCLARGIRTAPPRPHLPAQLLLCNNNFSLLYCSAHVHERA